MTKTEKQSKPKKKHKIRSLIYRIFLIAVAGLTVGLSVYSWNAQRVVGNQLPMPFGFGASVVLTGSMEPTLKVNDLVFVVEQDDYQEGDIVVYQNGRELIIHRIVRISDDLIVTQGDANNAADDPITKDQIKGKYTFRIPFVGFVFKILKSLPGTLCVLALVVFLMYRSRRKERKVGDEELDQIVAEIRALQEQQKANTPAAGTAEDKDQTPEPESTKAPDPEPVKAEEPKPETKADSVAEVDETVAQDSAEDVQQTEAEQAKVIADQDTHPVSDGSSELSSLVDKLEDLYGSSRS